jgi:hypothetical protein
VILIWNLASLKQTNIFNQTKKIMKKTYLILLLGIASIKGYSQTPITTTVTPVVVTPTPAKEWDVSMYGFVRTDYIWDSRKSAQVREDNLNLYPLDEALDVNNKDLNAVGQSNFLSVSSRLGVKAKGPDVWGAKMTGVLEGDFFGNVEGASIGMFRLRHAYISMDWAKTSLTMGQTWYPTFIPEVFPGVANFSTGILFNPFGWATQVKIKQNFTKELSLALTLYKEREFTTPTVAGGTQNSASINSALPTIHGQFQFKNKNWIAGIGAEFKSLQPLTEYAPTTTTKSVNTETVNSSSVMGYFKYSNDAFSIKGYGISGSNLQNLVMLGGFAGYSTSGQPEKYEASKTNAFWLDIASNGKKIAPGLFIGMTTNNGTGRTSVAGETVKYYMRGVTGSRTVDQVMRIAGRVDFKQNKFRITPEIEYTGATWADLNSNGNATADLNAKKVANIRFLASCVYSF